MEKENQAEREIDYSLLSPYIFTKVRKIVGAHKYLFYLSVLEGDSPILIKIISSFAILR